MPVSKPAIYRQENTLTFGEGGKERKGRGVKKREKSVKLLASSWLERNIIIIITYPSTYSI